MPNILAHIAYRVGVVDHQEPRVLLSVSRSHNEASAAKGAEI